MSQQPEDICNPHAGEVWEHRDGGSLYLCARTARMVCVQRRPRGDSQGEARWMRLSTFAKCAVHRIRASVEHYP